MNKMIVLPLLLVVALCVFAEGSEAKVPILYSTDLYHPHGDPDDHYDLATLFAIEEFDIRGIVIDVRYGNATNAGGAPIEQMTQITKRHVPCAIGITRDLANRTDKVLDEPAKFQGGIELILSVLHDAKEKVVIFIAGSCRDVAAALNREPDLFQKKVRAIYVNAGNYPGQFQWEHNVHQAPKAYHRLFEAGLTIYWCPCWGSKSAATRLQNTGGYATFFVADQARVVGACTPAVRNFFTYCLTRSKAEPIAFLQSGPHPLPNGKRCMWCTAPFFHAAGRKVYQRGADDFVTLSPAEAKKAGLADNAVDAYRFEPVRTTVGDNKGKTILRADLNSKRPNGFIFRTVDKRYGQIMESCLKNLLAELGR